MADFYNPNDNVGSVWRDEVGNIWQAFFCFDFDVIEDIIDLQDVENLNRKKKPVYSDMEESYVEEFVHG